MESLIKDYTNLVFSICLKMTGDYFTAEDLTQETFLSAYEHMENFQGDQWKAWICRIASNLCIDYQRQAARRMIPTEEEAFATQVSKEADPLDSFLNQETMERMKENCRHLKPPYDKISYWYFCENRTADEIAFKENKNKKTIQTQIYRAREMLKEECRKERGGFERYISER